MASKSSAALERYRRRAAQAYADKRQTVRAAVSAIEIIAGAGASGYVAAIRPDVAGIPTDAGTGIALLAGGMALESADMIATGLGFIAGYARSQGEKLGAAGLPFQTPYVVNE